jgi:hypothetical protein
LQQLKHSRNLSEAAMLTTPTSSSPALPAAVPTSGGLFFRDTDLLLEEHARSVGSFHAACRAGYRWQGRALGWAELIDGLLARRFVTTLLLVGVPALIVALLV